MGVTKKKVYLKPEITKFEMKMEAPFLAGSKQIIIEDPTGGEDGGIIEILLSASCTSGGQGLFLEVGECNNDININKNLSVNINGGCIFWTDEIIKKIGVEKGDPIKLCRISETTFTVTNIAK